MPWEFSTALLFTTLWNYFFMKSECSKTYLSQGYKIYALDHIGSLSMQQTIHLLAGLSLLYGSTCPLKVVYHHAIFHTTCLATAQPATSLTGLTAKDCGKCMSGLPTELPWVKNCETACSLGCYTAQCLTNLLQCCVNHCPK